jgi:hypothetical protein
MIHDEGGSRLNPLFHTKDGPVVGHMFQKRRGGWRSSALQMKRRRPMFCTNTAEVAITANDVGSIVSQLVVISVQRASARAAPSVNGLARLVMILRDTCATCTPQLLQLIYSNC